MKVLLLNAIIIKRSTFTVQTVGAISKPTSWACAKMCVCYADQIGGLKGPNDPVLSRQCH